MIFTVKKYACVFYAWYGFRYVLFSFYRGKKINELKWFSNKFNEELL